MVVNAVSDKFVYNKYTTFAGIKSDSCNKQGESTGNIVVKFGNKYAIQDF